jgi:hypothetical protein
MADLPDSNGDTGDDPGVTGRGSTTGTPRWVKVFLIVIIAVVLSVVILLLIGGHGPSRH